MAGKTDKLVLNRDGIEALIHVFEEAAVAVDNPLDTEESDSFRELPPEEQLKAHLSGPLASRMLTTACRMLREKSILLGDEIPSLIQDAAMDAYRDYMQRVPEERRRRNDRMIFRENDPVHRAFLEALHADSPDDIPAGSLVYTVALGVVDAVRKEAMKQLPGMMAGTGRSS